MPVRDFSPSGVIRTALGAAGIEPPLTYAAVMRFGSANSQWLFSFANTSNVFAENWSSPGLEASKLRIYPGFTSAIEPPKPNVWVFIAFTKTSGSSKAKIYMYRYDTKAWTIGETTSAFTWSFTGTPAKVQLGRWNSEEQFTGRYAAATIFNKVLTEAEVKELAEGPSIEGWLTKEPKSLWMFNQAVVTEAVPDSTGNGANQESREGTSVVEEEPPIPYKPSGLVLQKAEAVSSTSLALKNTVRLGLVAAAGESSTRLSLGGVTVKVLKNGELVDAMRWVLIGGELKNG